MPRLDQLLSQLGYCSRREARDWIEAERVLVQGAPAQRAAQKVDPAEVSIDGEPPDHPHGVLVAMHKPLGCVCSHDPQEGPSVYDLLPPRWRRRNPAVTTIGRLDKETSGLLLLTDQSALVHRLTSPRHKVPKVYRVVVDRDLDSALARKFASGDLRLAGEDENCAPATLSLRGPREADLELTEGRYHQVRRMLAECGWGVLQLQRIRFGTLELGETPAGEWRELPLGFFGTAHS